MSTTENIPAATYIPGDEDIKVVETSSSWRFANGKIVRGQEIVEKAVTASGKEIETETGNYPEEKTSVLGILRRVWVYQGSNKFGPVYQLEADIETRDGMVHLKSKLLNSRRELAPSTSAINFAWCLLQFGKDSLMRIATVQGEARQLDDGTMGGAPTYVNAYAVVNGEAKPIYRPKRDPNAPRQTAIEVWTPLEEQLRAHPAWKEREIREEDEAPDGSALTHFRALCQECASKGWPTPEELPEAWLKLVAMFFEDPNKPKPGQPGYVAPVVKTSLAGYNEDEWGVVRQAIMPVVQMPGVLKAALEAKPAPAATTPPATVAATNSAAFGADEDDPFPDDANK
jgi:hypothetical protein